MTPELIIFVFLAGVATIVSPCVLPMLPIVLSTSSGVGRMRPVGVVLGLALSFTFATLVAGAAVQALAVPTSWLRVFAIVALGLFGLSMLIPAWARATERLFTPLSRLTGGANRSGFGGGMLMGAGLGLLWAPCVGPIMGTVIALAVTNGLSGGTVGITLAYALGAVLPMLAIAYGARSLTSGTKWLRPHTETIRRAFGGLTVLACLALLFGLETNVQTLLPSEWNTALTGFERQETVQKDLKTLEDKERQMPALPPVAAALQPTPIPATSTPVPPAKPTAKPGIALKDLGPAPELTGLTEWINSKPLTLKDLRGKVVIVDFWTFGCYNCRNTEPYVRALYDKYKSQGLEILGIHSPEFAYEHVPDNVRAATKEQGVTWPVALDPDFKTWNAYNNRYWPAFYFIDANGHIRYTHFGEGNYDYNDKVVQQLLSEANVASK